jgi:ABC-type glutathione transport system ATPase component
MFTCVCSSSTDSVRRPSTNLQVATTIARTVTHGQIPHAFNTGAHSSSRTFPSRTIGSPYPFALYSVSSRSSFTSCFLLQFWTVDVHFSAARTRNDDPDASAGKEIMKKSRDRDGVKKVDVELVDIALEIYKPSLRRGKGRTLNVLKSVSTKFQAGELNVILGPSGSGKSSLLNTMARRLRSSLLTRYRRQARCCLTVSSQQTRRCDRCART